MTYLHNKEPTVYFCCLGCNNCWLGHRKAEEHISEECDEKDEHIKRCKDLLGDAPSESEGMTEEDIEKIKAPLNAEIENLKKEIKKLNNNLKLKNINSEETEEHSAMLKRLCWVLVENYDKEHRAELLEKIESIRPHRKYEFNWEGFLLTEYDKGFSGNVLNESSDDE